MLGAHKAKQLCKSHPVHGRGPRRGNDRKDHVRFWGTVRRNIPHCPGYGPQYHKNTDDTPGHHDGHNADRFKRQCIRKRHAASEPGLCLRRRQGEKLRIHGGGGVRPVRRTEDRMVSGGRYERNPHAERRGGRRDRNH